MLFQILFNYYSNAAITKTIFPNGTFNILNISNRGKNISNISNVGKNFTVKLKRFLCPFR